MDVMRGITAYILYRRHYSAKADETLGLGQPEIWGLTLGIREEISFAVVFRQTLDATYYPSQFIEFYFPGCKISHHTEG
jgi:hypothetical protein